MTETSTVLAAFEDFDTGTVSDALDRVGITGVISGLGRLTTNASVVGFANTVQLGPDDGSPSTRHLCAAAIESGGPTTIIVVAGGKSDCGGWGGLLSRAAAHKGVRAAVVDGASRDVDEAAAMGFPVFARTSSPSTARGRQRELTSGEPVRIADVMIRPGDIVMADGTGVVVVPADRADEVLAVARMIDERERDLAARISAGEEVSVVLGSNYESMLRRKGER